MWQVQRLAWKLDLIAKVDARVHAAPGALPDRFDAQADEYRRVRVRGHFLDRSTLVQAVTERGAGFWVLTPLVTDSGTVLVNRGFVPSGWKGAPPARDVTLTGLLRVSEPKGGFLRSNDPAHDRWYSRDVEAIAKAQGLGATAPYFIDADATPNPGGYPVGGLTVIRFSNNHLVYALTWFALALGSLFGAWLLRKRPA